MRKPKKGHLEKRGINHEKKEIDAKKKYATIFISIIMIFSVFAFALSFLESSNKIKYKDLVFKISPDGLWKTKIENDVFYFLNPPNRLESIIVENSIIEFLKDKYVYQMTYDPNMNGKENAALAIFMYQQNLKDSKIVIPGMTKENEYDISVITCHNATENMPVILFEEPDYDQSSNFTPTILLTDNCVHIIGKDIELFQLAERLLYGILGII